MTVEVIQKTIGSFERQSTIKKADGFQTINQLKFINKITNWYNQYKDELKWQKIIFIFTFHILCIPAVIVLAYSGISIYTVLWGCFIGSLSGLGVTAGVHRLWSHRTYKAKPQLEMLLLIFYSIVGQTYIFEWVRDHRVHHKHSDTDADPHNSKRGFFFSHCGWLMMKKHRLVVEKGRQIDMSDITNNPYIIWHTRYFIPLQLFFCFFIPAFVPIYFWHEDWLVSVMSMDVLRYWFFMNITWSVNSFAHVWGIKPYDKRIYPGDNFILSLFAMGEGWHNYHHVFPWDYKTGEYGGLFKPNVTKIFIDLMAKIGWAYDLKEPSNELIKQVIAKHGDLHDAPEQVE